MLSAEVSLLGTEQGKSGLARSIQNYPIAMVTFPYRGILQYKSGCAANGLRPSTGSPSLLEQS